jgi:hypothetical protein
MKKYKELLHLQEVSELPRTARGSRWWWLAGETIDGTYQMLRTSRIGRGERRWNPSHLVGDFLRITYHITEAGNFNVDLWRTSSDENEDLAERFAEERRRHRAEQDRLAILSVLESETIGSALGETSRRL